LIPAIAAGAPTRVTLAACARVRALIDAPGRLHVLALLAEAPVLLDALPVARDRAVELPAGRYRLLLQAAGRLGEHECQLAAGSELELPPPPAPERFLELPGGFTGQVFPAGWFPAVVLPVAGARVGVPPGPPPRVLVAHSAHGSVTIVQRVVFSAAAGALRLPDPPREWRSLAPQDPAAEGDGWRFSVEPLARGLEVVAFAPGTDPVRLPVAGPNGAFLVWPRARAPLWLAGDRDHRYRTLAGASVHVEVEAGGAGEALAAELALVHREQPWLRLRAPLDARGRAHVAHLPPGEVTLHITSSDFRPERRELELADGETRRLRIALRTGARLSGQAFLPDGRPAARAIAELRDPANARDVEPQRTFADRDGRFVFGGLPDDAVLTLWVSLELEGRTWSGQLRGVQPGDDCRLDLRLEDPAPPSIR
jgi:hypothetical protein